MGALPNGSKPRAFAVSAVVTLGFVVVFGAFGLIITPLALSVEKYLPWATIVIGFVLVGLGISLLRGRELTAHIPKLNKGGRDGTLLSMFLYGISYAIASLSCTIGPFLAVTSTTFRNSNLISGIGVFVAYALGMGIIVTALTVAVFLDTAAPEVYTLSLHDALPISRCVERARLERSPTIYPMSISSLIIAAMMYG